MGVDRPTGTEKDPVPLPLAEKLAVEWTSAITSALTVAPAISIIDKAIFANASGRERLATGIMNGVGTMLTKPVYFFRQPSFLLIWGVYSGTYIVANSIESVCTHYSIDWFYPKFIGASIANVSLSVMKDLYFTRAFGKVTASPVTPTPSPAPTTTTTTTIKSTPPPSSLRPVPFRSYSLYTLRDTLTIFASFNMPILVSDLLIKSNTVSSRPTADLYAQLITPCAVQIVSTPLHLLGMDYYNSPNANVSQRVKFIGREYVATTLARMGRIFPAYGIGGVANKKFRSYGKQWLIQTKLNLRRDFGGYVDYNGQRLP
ncbi:hypothetical protein HDU76_002212 [Blyttiomyces sp. JEL0837]|nr:hypothetical protein HDU76_002212 [Blyttiomyces sp. JEL0837]